MQRLFFNTVSMIQIGQELNLLKKDYSSLSKARDAIGKTMDNVAREHGFSMGMNSHIYLTDEDSTNWYFVVTGYASGSGQTTAQI